MDWDNRSNSKFIAEGAILAAVAASLGLLGIYIPPLSILTSLVWLVPLIVVTQRWGLKRGTLTLFLAGLLLGLLSTPVEALLLLVEYGGLALVYGQGFRKMESMKKILAKGILVAVLGSLAMIAISMGILGVEIEAVSAQLQGISDQVITLYDQAGLMEQFADQGLDRQALVTMIDQVVRSLIIILPSILVVMAMVTAAISLFISRRVLAKLKIKVPDKLPPFHLWRVDFRLVYGVILALALFLLGDYLDQALLSAMASNLLLALGFIFLLGGISVVVHMAKHWQSSTLSKVLLVILALVFFQMVFFLFVFIGLFDLFFDYRGRIAKKGDKNEGNSK